MKFRANICVFAVIVVITPLVAFSLVAPGGAATVPSPAVTGLSPDSGTTAGGVSVAITGTNFTGATSVHFGTVAATSFNVLSATSIAATAPALSPNVVGNTVNVTVTTGGGTSTTSVNDQYVYTYNNTSNPSNPVSFTASSTQSPLNGSVTLTATASSSITVDEDYGMSILDVTTPSNPIVLDHIYTGTTATAQVSQSSAQTHEYVAEYDACMDYPAPCLAGPDAGRIFLPDSGDGAVATPIKVTWSTAPVPTSGYRFVASDGGVFDFGNAFYYGSTGAMTLNKPVVGMAATPDGKGYWLVASDGGIFNFGDAVFYGSTGAMALNKPIVGMTSTPDGKGYWLVASDGGIFSYGDAFFYGSTGAVALNKPIVGMAAT
jgi:hypothetical protein